MGRYAIRDINMVLMVAHMLWGGFLKGMAFDRGDGKTALDG